MKKTFFLALLALALVSCSTTDTTPVDSTVAVLPEGTSAPSLPDPMMADDLPAPEGALSTPVEPAPTPEAPPLADATDSSMSTATETSADLSSNTATESTESLTGTTDSSLGTESAALTEPTAPEETATETSAEVSTDTSTAAAAEATPKPEPVPAPAVPEANKPLPPVVASGPASDRNIYEDYREYKDQVNSRTKAEDAFEARTLFPHEGGAFQLGIDYVYRPFADFDFDPGVGVQHLDSQGAALSFNYFPLRSLSYGRLGVGLQGAAYWTKYSFTSGGFTDTSRVHSIDTYGGRLIYEFQYFLGQTLVPHVFYGYDKVRVRPFSLATAGVSYPSRSFTSQSYGVGAHLNLNRLEPSAASKALASTGIRKFYLTYTFQVRAEDTGSSHYLGLRFEY